MADNDFLQGAQIGLGIAQQWAQRSARQQELRVQEAYRRMQERRLAAEAEHTMQQTEMLKQTAQQAVIKRARNEAAQIGLAADIDMGMTPEAAALKNFLPGVAEDDPSKVPDFLADVARIKLIQEQTKAAGALAEKRLMEATDTGLGVGDDAIPYVAEFRGVPFLVNPKSGAAQRIRQEQMTEMQRMEYGQALRDVSAIERELAKEPPHPEGRDEKGEKVPVQSDKRQNLLEELIKARKRVARIATQANTVTPAPIVAPADNLPADYRVKVKAPDGRLFTIPKDQLEDAVKQGYTEVP